MSVDTVAAIMHEQGLKARSKRRRKQTTRQGNGRWREPDLVGRDFGADQVNRKLYGDGMGIVTDEGNQDHPDDHGQRPQQFAKYPSQGAPDDHADNFAEGRKIAEKIPASFPSCPIPEIARLGRTVRQWRSAFLAYFTSERASNGGTEATA